MKPFLILRVPTILDENRNHVRRPDFGANPTVVGTAETYAEAASRVGGLSLGDVKHHYYGFELKLMGAPDRKSVITVKPKPAKGSKPRLAVDNRSKEKAR